MKRALLLAILLSERIAQGQDITYDGIKNGLLQFHRGNLHIEAKCEGGILYVVKSKNITYSGCLLPGLPGNATSEKSVTEMDCKTDEDVVYYDLSPTFLSFHRYYTKKCEAQLETLKIVNMERKP